MLSLGIQNAILLVTWEMSGAAGVARQTAGELVEVKSNNLDVVVETCSSLLAKVVSLSRSGTDCQWSRFVEMVEQAGVVRRDLDWAGETHEGNQEKA